MRDVRINRVDIQILNVYIKGRLIYKRIGTNFCYGILTFFLLRRNIIFRVSFRIEQFVIKNVSYKKSVSPLLSISHEIISLKFSFQHNLRGEKKKKEEK